MTILLRSITLRPIPEMDASKFPNNIPTIRSLNTLEFSQPVTFFVGENGSGKSTLLEAIACAADSITVGASPVARDDSLAEVRSFSMLLRLAWSKRTRKGFFLRAEDFFGFARQLSKSRAALRQDLEELDKEMSDRSDYARSLARMPLSREISGYSQSYGEGLDNASHGESFLALFRARFVPEGLYLLDEPETPLSPLRQLAFISALKDMVAQNAQFIIATHSPILLAYPGAEILSFDDGKIQNVAYESLEHVKLTRDFLNNPEAFLRHL